MQLQDVKKILIHRIIAATLLAVGGVAGYFIVGKYQQVLVQEQQSVQKEITSVNAKINTLEHKQQEYDEAKKLWDRLSDRQKKRDGLEIAATQQLLDQLKNYYLLRTLKLNMSKPVELTDRYKTTTTVVLTSRVTLVFEGLSDEQVLSFLGALFKYMPGYMTVRTFHISRELSVTDGVLEKIKLGTSLPMVKGDLTFDWRDLKDATQDAPSNPLPQP